MPSVTPKCGCPTISTRRRWTRSSRWPWRSVSLNDIIFRHSDIITFHNYSKADTLRSAIATLKQHGRPIINTEWLNRPAGSLVEDCLPVFAAENVGCMHWGLVNGSTQTHLRWGARPGKPEPETWQHDLFHGDHMPYARAEIDLFKKTIATSRK